MISDFMQRLVGLFSSPHKAYARAYDLYEGYTRKVHLGLGVPTPEQVLAARVSSELIEAEELYQKALALCREKRLGPNETVVLYQLALPGLACDFTLGFVHCAA